MKKFACPADSCHNLTFKKPGHDSICIIPVVRLPTFFSRDGCTNYRAKNKLEMPCVTETEEYYCKTNISCPEPRTTEWIKEL